MAETGDGAPCTLAGAFLKPVAEGDLLAASVERLEATRDAFARAYGDADGAGATMDVPGGRGTLADVIALARA